MSWLSRCTSVLMGAALILFCGTLPVEGQWTLGLQGGASRSTFIGADVSRADWVTGFSAGASARLHLVDELSFQMELMYAEKGADVRVDWNGAGHDARVRVAYVEVPIAFRLDVQAMSHVTAHVLGGPYGAVNVSCTVDPAGRMHGSSSCNRAALDMGVHALDLGLLGGVGLDVALGEFSAFVGSRYQVGLRKIDDGEQGWNRTNSAFSFLTGVAVPLGSPPRVAARQRR